MGGRACYLRRKLRTASLYFLALNITREERKARPQRYPGCVEEEEEEEEEEDSS